MHARCLSFSTLSWVVSAASANQYKIDDASCASRESQCPIFDGIAALSAGATSVLLPDFPEAQRDAIMDYLFKPNFGASLQVLKVEIGGDDQSTDGAEPSHMHSPFEEPDYNRGYEWLLLKEARKRNPKIKLWGLPWAWPQWVACNLTDYPASCDPSKNWPYVYLGQAADYIVKWVEGAKRVHNLTIDYIGDWNEDTPNNDYLKKLRKALDAAGFKSTLIASWDLCHDCKGGVRNYYQDMIDDPELSAAVYSVGLHYPGTLSDAEGFETKLQQKIWASEDDSTYNGLSGAGCWGRIINENYVHGNMTLSVHWNIAAAYQKGTGFYRSSIMNTLQPWGGGSYGIWRADGVWSAGAKVWMTAHTTQFTEPDTFRYLPVSLNGTSGGAGQLKQGGSYVTFKNFETNDFTVVIEKMSRDRSYCAYGQVSLGGFSGLAMYNTSTETVALEFDGTMLPADGSSVRLYIWKSYFASTSTDKTTEFEQQVSVEVSRSQPTAVLQSVEPNTMWTVTTVATGHKGTPATDSEPAQPSLFPTNYTNDFEKCPLSSEGSYFSDQSGAWECVAAPEGTQHASHGTVMKQMVPIIPIRFGAFFGGPSIPYSLIGHRDMTNMTIEHDVYFANDNDTTVLGVRMQDNTKPSGAFFVLAAEGTFFTTNEIYDLNDGKGTNQGHLKASAADGKWHRLSMAIIGTDVVISFDGKTILSYKYDGGNNAGFGLLASLKFNESTLIDNFGLTSAQYNSCDTQPAEIAAGTKLSVVECGTEVGVETYPKRQWIFNGADTMTQHTWGDSSQPSVLKFEANPDLCLEATSASSPVVLAVCNNTKDTQLFTWLFAGASRSSQFQHKATGLYLNFDSQATIGSDLLLSSSKSGVIFYDIETHELSSQEAVACIGVC